MITGICYGCAPVGAAWSVGVLLVGAGPVGLVEHRPRRPDGTLVVLDRAAGITRPIGSASTLMPPGMLGGSPKAAAATVCTVHVGLRRRAYGMCVARDSPQSKRQQTTEACRCQL
jgi:hypothetical protein